MRNINCLQPCDWPPGTVPPPGSPYSPRCTWGIIFPPTVMLERGSKPRACRYIQRCCFSKAESRDELIFSKGTSDYDGRKRRHRNRADAETSPTSIPGRQQPLCCSRQMPPLREPSQHKGRTRPEKQASDCCATRKPRLPRLRKNTQRRRRSRRTSGTGLLKWTLSPAMQCAPVSRHLKSLRETLRPTKHCETSNLPQGPVAGCYLEPSGPRFRIL